MKETIMKKYRLLNRIMDRISENHTGAYAAQSAFFIVLSMIPFIMLLLALVQYTPVTKADVIRAVTHVLPKTIYPMIVSIVNQVYNQSQAMISLTGLVAIWSAGRGVLAMSAGLNSVYGSKETRNYIYLRLRAAFYTVLFIIAIVLSLVILGFGDRLSIFIVNHYPFMKGIIDLIINIRAVASIVVLTVFSMTIYHFLPNKKTKFIRQFLFSICQYFYRIFYDVWKYDDNHADHALAVCMYVYYAAWRRSKRDAGRRFFHIYVGRWQIQWKKADTFVKLFWRRMIWEGYIYVLYL